MPSPRSCCLNLVELHEPAYALIGFMYIGLYMMNISDIGQEDKKGRCWALDSWKLQHRGAADEAIVYIEDTRIKSAYTILDREVYRISRTKFPLAHGVGESES